MTEQLLNGLFGKVAVKEFPHTMSPKPATESGRTSKTENLLQADADEESFSEKLAVAIESISVSNKQAIFSASRSTLSNQEEDPSLIMKMISKGIFPDMESLQEQLSHAFINTNKETFNSSGVGYISDSNTASAPIQLHTLLDDVRQNPLEAGEGILSPSKSMKLNIEDVSSLSKATQNGEEKLSLAKFMQNGEEISALVKALQNGEEISALAKDMKNGKEISPLLKAMENGEEVSSFAKAMQNNREVLTVARPVKSGGEVSALIKEMRLNSDDISSPAKTMRNSEGILSIVKSEEGSEEVSILAKVINEQNSHGNPSNKIYGQIPSQDIGKTVPEESSLNPAEVEDSELHHALNISKSQELTTSFNDNNIPGNVRLYESTNQATVSQDNSFLNNQGSDTAKEADINLTNIKQGIEPKINFANASSQINVPQPFESLGVDLVDNFIQRARLFMQGDKSAIRLQLNPPELGSLKLEFTVEDDVLEAKIFVERAGVKEIIEKDIPRLRELVSHTEIDVGKLDVFLQERGGESLGFMEKGFQSYPEGDQTQEYTNQEKEDFGSETDEELKLNVASTNKINYLV